MPCVGKVYLVGAGPGDPNLLTLKALRADRGGGSRRLRPSGAERILDTDPDGARRIIVGKQASCASRAAGGNQRDAGRLGRAGRTRGAAEGRRPFIFGRGCEEAAELAARGIPFEVVPGITAAQGCAASARHSADPSRARRRRLVTSPVIARRTTLLSTSTGTASRSRDDARRLYGARQHRERLRHRSSRTGRRPINSGLALCQWHDAPRSNACARRLRPVTWRCRKPQASQGPSLFIIGGSSTWRKL